MGINNENTHHVDADGGTAEGKDRDSAISVYEIRQDAWSNPIRIDESQIGHHTVRVCAVIVRQTFAGHATYWWRPNWLYCSASITSAPRLFPRFWCCVPGAFLVSSSYNPLDVPDVVVWFWLPFAKPKNKQMIHTKQCITLANAWCHGNFGD